MKDKKHFYAVISWWQEDDDDDHEEVAAPFYAIEEAKKEMQELKQYMLNEGQVALEETEYYIKVFDNDNDELYHIQIVKCERMGP